MDVKKLRAKDIMKTDVKSINKSLTIIEAARMMMDLGLSSLIVEPEADWDSFGMITRKDIVEAMIEDPKGMPQGLVGDIMSKPAITVNIDLSIYNCQLLMRSVGIRRMPVLKGNKLVGILSNTDIFKKLVENME